MTNGFEFEVRGTNRVANPLRKTAAKFTDIADLVMGEWAKAERAKLKSEPYPPKLPNQKYKRTGELANRWRAIRKKAGVWSLANARPGIEYVIGDKQASIHAGRWYLAEAKISKETPALVTNLTAAFSEALKPE